MAITILGDGGSDVTDGYQDPLAVNGIIGKKHNMECGIGNLMLDNYQLKTVLISPLNGKMIFQRAQR
jgi:hypothetical protein